SQSYIDPCTGEDVISEEDLNDAISAACSGDGRHAANTFSAQINEALEGNPHIKLSKNLATDCPKLNCILNKLLGEGEPSSDFLCNMLDQFDGNPTIGIRATVPKLGEPNFLGKTQVVNGKNILISFNKNNCNSTE